VDSTRFQARLTVRIDPGPRSRVGAVDVEGVTSVDPSVIKREVPIRAGDWFSAGKVSQGRQRIFRLDLVNMAMADVAPIQESDSTVRVLFQVREGRQRSVSGEVGYTNTGGVALGGEWEHRNFVGGARTLSVSGSGESGALAVFNEAPDRYLRAAVSLRQPYLFVPDLSFAVGPFGEYRDDYRDRSWEAGLDGTLTYQLGPLQAVSLRYRLSNREVLEYRGPDGNTATAGFIGGQSLIESLEETVLVSAFTLSATLEELDDPANPRRGAVLQPSVEATAPLGFPTNEYVKTDLAASLFRPVGGRGRFAVSLRAGRLFPFGGSVPPSDSTGALEFLQLRDVNLTAGGPSDVRGWGSRLLGPKLPDVEFEGEGDAQVYSAARYLPLGGLARVTGGVELELPLSRMGSALMGHVFLEGGRVWTPDHRFMLPDDPFDQDRAYYSTGAGVGIETPVGPIRISLGYKLNPSVFDVRDPGEVLDLILEGRSILEAPARNIRRLQLHLTVGRTF
jgi:outer membrane protein insertion porin family